MTSRQLLWLLVRRWYLVILGMALTLVVLWPVTHRPGVFWAQVNLVLLPPTSEYFPNKLEDPQVALSALAGVVVSDYNGQLKPPLMASAGTTLYGEGRTTGTEVRMPNLGSQWKPLYPTATIDVQAVAASPEVVTQEIGAAIGKINRLLAERQEELGVDPSFRVSSFSSPADPSVYYITGSRMRALGAGAVVGMGLTVAGVYWLERFLLARRSRTSGDRPQTSDSDSEMSHSRPGGSGRAAQRPPRSARRRANVAVRAAE